MIIKTEDLAEFCKNNYEKNDEFGKNQTGKFDVFSVEEAFKFCEKVAKSHYENFPVSSILIPKNLRKHFYSIYAFSRVADDIADEFVQKNGKTKALELLENYEKNLENLYFSQKNNSKIQTSNPIFLALNETIQKFNIPKNPFKNLLKAFKKDINFSQPNDFSELFSYCENSANPVGELLLRLFDECNSETLHYSNKICSALQLINFWQDLSVDLRNGRNYIPKSAIKKVDFDFNIFENNFNKTKEIIVNNKEPLNNVLEEICYEAEITMQEGKKIFNYMKKNDLNTLRFKFELRLIIFGGEFILRKIKRKKEKIFYERPKIF
jgi:squalene synthase HpnC